MLLRSARPPLLALLAALGGGLGCSSETSSTSGTIDAASLPIIVISSPESGACAEVPLDAPAGVPIALHLAARPPDTTFTFLLEAPGTCGTASACGYFTLLVKDQSGAWKPNNAGINDVIEVLSTPENPLSGEVEVMAKLVSDTGVAFKDPDGNPITATVSFIAKPSCGTGTGGSTTSSGTGGTGGSTTSSGTGGTGATGGSTTSSGTGGAGASTTSTGGAGGAGASTTTTGTGGAGGATTTTTGTGGV